jgi:hypothetical protein
MPRLVRSRKRPHFSPSNTAPISGRAGVNQATQTPRQLALAPNVRLARLRIAAEHPRIIRENLKSAA